MYAVVQPYVTYAQLQAEVMKLGLTITVAEAGSQVSVVANNMFQGMGGTGHKFGYNRGVLGCDWILPNGDLLHLGSRGNAGGEWFWGDCAGMNLKGLAARRLRALRRAGHGYGHGGQALPLSGPAGVSGEGKKPEFHRGVPARPVQAEPHQIPRTEKADRGHV